jgi:hypothetical protein
MEDLPALDILQKYQDDLCTHAGYFPGAVVCSDLVPVVGAFSQTQFFIAGNRVAQVTTAGKHESGAQRFIGRFRTTPKVSSFCAFAVHEYGLQCNKHHFRLCFHATADTMTWSGKTLATYYFASEQFQPTAPAETGSFYVIFDAQKKRWGYGITQREEGRLAEYRKHHPAVCIWRIWKTEWPLGALAALENAVRAALAAYKPYDDVTGTRQEWFEGSGPTIQKIVLDLVSVFGAKIGTPATEVLLPL